ncbi:MAG: hypothetical protein Q4G45_08555 [Actinomycetia bacterium]|nr:hypothetical protein [Actinomycetes bacterium]
MRISSVLVTVAAGLALLGCGPATQSPARTPSLSSPPAAPFASVASLTPSSEVTSPEVTSPEPSPAVTIPAPSPVPTSPTPSLAPASPAQPPAPVPTQPTRQAADDEGSGSCQIKGNISAKGERIYHVPGQRSYNQTKISPAKGERWFCSEAQAQAAGWRRAKN